MLTPAEEEFLEWWPKQRDRQKRWTYQLAVGLPVGLLISVLIITNFSAGWYKRADMIATANFNPVVIYVAAAIIAIFIAIFSKKFQWDQQELRYKELTAKKEQSKSNQ